MTKTAFRASARLAAIRSAALLAVACGAAPAAEPAPGAAAETLRLWPGAAPGTQDWTGPEAEADADLPMGKVHVVTNVTVPTLAVFRPAGGKANGTAMVVVPGGSFRALAWDLDGTETAQWLAARGITAFVLKYRVRPPGASAPTGPETFDSFLVRTRDARAVAVADARQALRLVRRSAATYGVRLDRVGMIGFSAGAIATLAVASGGEGEPKPDFAVALYGALPPDADPTADSPPLFVAAAADDPQVPPAKSTETFDRWTRAGRPAELHLYEKGGHGFGFRLHGLPADSWPQALEAWLASRGLAGPVLSPRRPDTSATRP